MERNVDMKRIIIVGCSCSGKTTLAGNISEILDIPHFELDVLHWGPNWTTRKEFEEDVAKAVKNPSWVFDGNYRKARNIIWDNADTIIWVNYSFPLVFWRALKRTLPRVFLKKTTYAGNRETIQTTFFSSDSILWWVIKTHNKRLKEYSKLLLENQFPNIKIIEFRHPKQAEKFLSNLESNSG
jgi:adenylate kinase family enzyme